MKKPANTKPAADPLWQQVTESITPLKKDDRLAVTPPKITSHNGGITRVRSRADTVFEDAVREGQRGAVTPSALGAPGQLDRRTRRKLGRGTEGFDAVIDLHGLSRERAYKLLASRIPSAYHEGKSIILVITGKGGARFQQTSDAQPVDRRKRSDFALHEGILRNALQGWLAGAALRPYVAAMEEAAQHHGGAGACYVRLKKRPPLGR